MYVVEFLFSKEGEKIIQDIWNNLIEKGLNSDLNNMLGIKPHITLAVYDEINEEDFKIKLNSFKGSFSNIKLKFDSIGTFPSTGTCFLKPTVTSELLEIHKNFHYEFNEYSSRTSSYYLPGNWNPHCTLGTRLENSKLIDVFSYALSTFNTFEVDLIDIALIKIEFLNNNESRSYRIL